VIRPRIHFEFQVAHIGRPVRRLAVTLGVAGGHDVEIIWRGLAYERNQVARVGKIAIGKSLPFGRVASEGEDILDSSLAELFQYIQNVDPVQADTRQMRDAFDPVFIFDVGGDVYRRRAVLAASRAVGHTDKVGRQIAKLIQCPIYAVRRIRPLGREYLE
jgi:hypothetical protein